MKKVLFFAVALSFSFSTAHACKQGDLSKTLLLTSEYQGEENALIGEVDNKTGAVTAARYGFAQTNGPLIAIKMLSGQVFKFDRRNTQKMARYCFPVIFGN